MKRLLRGLTGLILLAALIGGAPWLFWQIGGDLLPDHIPSPGEAWDALTGPDSGRMFLGALLIVAVVAWAVLVVVTVLELAAALSGRRRRRIRGLGWAQGVAGVLIGMVMVGTVGTGTATARPLPPLSHAQPASTAAAKTVEQPVAATAHRPVQPPSHAQPASATAVTGQTWTVSSSRDTLWSIAEQTLGDGDRFADIVKLNDGRIQADGSRFSADSSLHAGWVLILPTDARTDHAANVARPPTSAPPARHVIAQPGDTLSGIAQQELGDANRYDELAVASGISDPDQLEIGQLVTIPAIPKGPTTPRPSSTPTMVEVQPGESLSQIAADHGLDDWTALWEANKGRAEPGGGRLTDPDLIEPGWTVQIPGKHAAPPPDGKRAAPSAHPELHHPHVAGPHPRPPAATPQTPPEHQVPITAPTPAPGAPDRGIAPPEAAAPTPAAPDRDIAPPVTAPTTAAPTTAVVAPPRAPQDQATTPLQQPPISEQQPASPTTDRDVTSVASVLAGLSALAAAATWGALVAARKRGHRRRSPGRQAAPAELAAIRTEKALRERAAELDTHWLDVALRSMADRLSTGQSSYPDIIAAYLSPDQLRLQLTSPMQAPPPFLASGTEWVLPAAVELPLAGARAADQMAPLPALASIGTRGDETVLLDLERAGAVTVTGPAAACRELLTHLVLELAHNVWSDGVNVTLVGWGDDLVALNPDRLVHATSLTGVVRELHARLTEAQTSMRALDTDVLTGRIQDLAGDSWMPQVLLIDGTGCPPEQLEALDDAVATLTRSGRTTTAVVLTGTHHLPAAATTMELILDDAGKLRVPALLGDQSIIAARVGQDEARELCALFTVADRLDSPTPPAAASAPWAAGMDDSGALLDPAPVDVEPDTHREIRNNDNIDQDSPAEDVVVPMRPVSPAASAQLALVRAADQNLDADLSEWHAEEILRPHISLLGPPLVAAPGTKPAHRSAWFTQVAIYLALHTSGVTPQKFTDDLWGAAKKPSTQTIRETLSRTRTWMGRSPQTGELYLPNANGQPYRIVDRITDVDLLRRLRKRAQARAAAADTSGAMEDYTRALQLVRGPADLAYPWMVNSDRMEDRHIPAWVADTAHDAAQLAMAHADLDAARWAANIGYLADPDSDLPLRDLLEIACRGGQMETAWALACQIVENNGVEVPEDLAPDTFAVINQAFPSGLRAAAQHRAPGIHGLGAVR